MKSNIGHLDTAAGIAGLIKTILALRHQQIPPSIHFDTPNPDIDFKNSAFFVNDRLRDWESEGQPRRGVSSFGLGGTNAHLILEEAPAAEPPSVSRDSQVIVFSGRTEEVLDEMRSNLTGFFAATADMSIADAAYTQAVGRARFPHRAAFVCRSAADATAALCRSPAPSSRSCTPAAAEIVFMFPGQGAQYAGMGRELYRGEPVYRRSIDRCADLLQSDLGIDLRDALYPALIDFESASLRLNETWLTQPALFATEYALAQLWMSWGIRPVAMIGHSIGEYVAACLANVFELTTALELVAAGQANLEAAGRRYAGCRSDAFAARGSVAAGLVHRRDQCPKFLRCVRAGGSHRRICRSTQRSERRLPPVKDFARVPFGDDGLRDGAVCRVAAAVSIGPAKDSVHFQRDGHLGQRRRRHRRELLGEALAANRSLCGRYLSLLPDSHRLFLEIGPGDTLTKLTRRQPLADKSRVVVTSISVPRSRRRRERHPPERGGPNG